MDEPFLSPSRSKDLSFDKNANKKEKVQSIKNNLKEGFLYWSLKRSVKGELIKSKYPLKGIEKYIKGVVNQNGLSVKLRNKIFKLHQKGEKDLKNPLNHDILSEVIRERKKISPKKKNDEKNTSTNDDERFPPPPIPIQEELDFVAKAQKKWSIFLCEQILSISKQLGIPIASNNRLSFAKGSRKKKKGKKGGLTGSVDIRKLNNTRKGKKSVTTTSLIDDLSDSDDDDTPKYTGVYGPSKFFETVVSINNPNHEMAYNTQIVCWGLIKLELKTPSIKDLRMEYKELSPSVINLGSGVVVEEEYENGIKKTIQNGFYKDYVYFCKTGLTSGIRGKVWKEVLGVKSNVSEKKYFNFLRERCRSVHLLIDDMIINDIKKTCDDENYFVFEGSLVDPLCCFSRDNWLLKNCKSKNVPIFGVLSSSSKNKKKKVIFPPNGIVPFEGLSLLCAPLGYVFPKVEDIYFTFRQLYARLFCKLQVISTKDQCLLRLCKLFENILLKKCPQAFFHLLELNIHPLDIAINWIFHAFAGYLLPNQLLLLWDRIVGFQSLNILPVLAASIFLIRSKFILETKSAQKIMDVFSDFTSIKVIPLIQMVLFLDGKEE